MSNNVGPRLLTYVACTALATVIAFPLGVRHFDRICDENDPEVTECDLGVVYGFFWSFWTLVGCLVVVIVIELTLAVRRHRHHRQHRSTSLPERPPEAT